MIGKAPISVQAKPASTDDAYPPVKRVFAHFRPGQRRLERAILGHHTTPSRRANILNNRANRQITLTRAQRDFRTEPGLLRQERTLGVITALKRRRPDIGNTNFCQTVPGKAECLRGGVR